MDGHAVATEVMAEAAAAGHPAARGPLASGVAAILAARNPELAWRYGERPTGENDTSITAWMVSASGPVRA
ncbi:MAG: hypothetical protein E2O39_04440 [Planctomycetota bacterium]|nr:MAG: hypothetical protein E2O39_04440 [Planctomycetota bacterium]